MGVTVGGDVPLVLLHGFLGCPEDWDEVVARLSADRRPLCPALPGHGPNVGLTDEFYTFEGSVVWAATELDGSKPCDLVGYSMGGRIALGVAAAFQKRIRRLVLVSASAGLEARDERERRLALDRKRAERLRTQPLETFLRDWYGQPLFASLAEEEGRLERLIARRSRQRGRELARMAEGVSPGVHSGLWDVLGDLSFPVLAVAGERDPKYVAVAERMAHLCPRGRAVIVPDAGHGLHVEAPAALARTLDAFLSASEEELEIDGDD